MTDKVDLRLLATGVPGLDTILGGGLPELSFNIIGGAPGSGKTTFAQQIMFGLATPERKALFFTAMGEPPVKMLRYQQQFSFFDFDKVGDSVNFISLAAQVEEGNYDAVLAQILEEVRMHAPALVFIDSFRSFIQGARGDQQEVAALQIFVQQLVAHMTTWNATSFLIGEYTTNEADQNPIFTVADGLIWLNQYVQRNAMSRKLHVIKMRGRQQRAGLHAFRIGRDGIEIFPRTLPAPEPLGAEPPMRTPVGRLSTGVPTLDEMFGGGIPAGYSVLLVGPTGSGKTMLSAEFLAAGAANGEKGVVALFERSPSQIINQKLDGLVRSGQVGMMSVRALDLSVDEMLHEIAGTSPPRQVQVFDEERRDDHTDSVVHPLLRVQLPHTGIDDRKAGLALTPGLEQLVGVLARVQFDLVELLDVVLARTVGALKQDVGVEVSPADLPPIRSGTLVAELAQVGQHGSRMNGAVLQMHRHPARRIEVGAVAFVVVLRDVV